MSKCKHTVPCGCNDVGLTTQTSCEQGTINCPTPDMCSETFCAGCVVYCGDSILDLNITQGDRMDKIIQMLVKALTDPGCIIPTHAGAITSIAITTLGAGYTVSQSFPNTPLLGGSGAGALGTVVTGAGGEITSVTITNPGLDYQQNDLLYQDTSVVGVPTTAAVFTVSIIDCSAVLGLHTTVITPTTITLAWLANTSATAYQVEYKLASATSWTLNTSILPTTYPTDMIGNLLPDTDYHIRVSNICAGGACYSVTLIVRTKQ